MKKIGIALVAAAITIAWAECPISSGHISGTPDKVLQKNNWELKVWITSKRTRSKGRTAKLYHNGQEVCPNKGQDELITPIGKLHYKSSKVLWGWHGWKPE